MSHSSPRAETDDRAVPPFPGPPMSCHSLRGVVMGLAAALLLTGCVVAEPVVVRTPPPPPPPQVEVVPGAPGPAYAWVGGHWAWRRGGYVWLPGYWAVPATPGYVWTPGHWAARPGGYVWVEGHWRVR